MGFKRWVTQGTVGSAITLILKMKFVPMAMDILGTI